MKKRYNDSQVKAIHHFKGPCLTLAGPGSGKTAVLTERTRYLIRERGVDPAQILVITFTKAAAMEMKERFLKLMGEEHCPVTFGTFHAVYFSILKHAYHYNASNIIREEQKYAFMREFVQKKQLEYEDEAEFITSILGEISTVKNTGVSIEHYYSTNCAEDIFRKLYQEYQSYLYGQRLIDFDDMLVYTYELFRERQDILSAWQRKFRYILIDEFQDINKIQFDVIKMLAKPENNLFVVGDDDQSIYRFRGARPEIMLHFRDELPGCCTAASRHELPVTERDRGCIALSDWPQQGAFSEENSGGRCQRRVQWTARFLKTRGKRSRGLSGRSAPK